MDALHYPPLLQLALGHAADAVGGEVGVPGLDAAQAAQVLVALLLPLGYQVAVCQSNVSTRSVNERRVFTCDLLLDAELVQLARDGFPPVEQIKHIPECGYLSGQSGHLSRQWTIGQCWSWNILSKCLFFYPLNYALCWFRHRLFLLLT